MYNYGHQMVFYGKYRIHKGGVHIIFKEKGSRYETKYTRVCMKGGKQYGNESSTLLMLEQD